MSVSFMLTTTQWQTPYVGYVTQAYVDRSIRSKRFRYKYSSIDYMLDLFRTHDINPDALGIKGDRPSLLYSNKRHGFIIDLRDRYLFGMTLPVYSIIVRRWNGINTDPLGE